MRLREMIAAIQQWQEEERDRVRQEREQLRQEKEELRERRKEWRDYTAIWIAILAALFTGWQAWEAHQARKDAHEQFMTAQSTAAQSAESARIDSQNALKIQTRLADRSAEQAKRSADAADQSNRLALDALHISQAAIIDATVELQGQAGDDDRVKVIAKIRNNGKTGSYSTRGHLSVIAAKLTEDQAYKLAVSNNTGKSPQNVLSSVFLSPGAGAEFRNEASLEPKYVPFVKNGAIPVWVFGQVRYRDVFNIPHQLDFCFKYNADTHFLDVCGGHNLSK